MKEKSAWLDSFSERTNEIGDRQEPVKLKPPRTGIRFYRKLLWVYVVYALGLFFFFAYQAWGALGLLATGGVVAGLFWSVTRFMSQL